MWFFALALLTSVSISPANAQTAAAPKTEQEKTLYALGVLLSRNLTTFALTPQEVALVNAGIADGVRGKSQVANPEGYAPKLQQLETTRRAAIAAGEKKRGADYFTKALTNKGTVKAPAGFAISTLKAGTGPSPKASSTVKVHYEGRLIDGTVFDSSIQRNEPTSFPLNGVIRCWTEGVQMMRVGGKSRLICPSDLAYGDGGSPPKIPGGATLVFDVELLAIEKP
jgi:FKBP-type peptidyl-prolyl cis-trans isomerase